MLSRKSLLKILAAVVVAGALYVAYDLLTPRTAHLKEFDSDQVARLETAMWRSYYEKRRVSLFTQMAELLRTQYNIRFIRSNQVAYYAAAAAFTFKKGKNRSDYEKALPDLIKFYTAIHQHSDSDFDVGSAARRELEWWIIHRERADHADGDLAKSLAELQAEIYRMPVEKFSDHGKLRAEAMTIRDNQAEAGGLTEADWARIEELLRQSWRSLKVAVNK